MVTVRVFLLDDHEVVRRGVRELLEAEDDLEIVGEAGTAQEAYARIPATAPDVAMLDVRLPDGDGIEVCREIRSTHPEVACLMLTSFADDEAVFSAILAGAAGYVLKQVRGTDLVDAVRRVGRGESILDPVVDRQSPAAVTPATRAGRACRSHETRTADPRPHCRGDDQPTDRRAALLGGEDGEELRVELAREVGHEPACGSGRLRRPAVGAASTPRASRLSARRTPGRTHEVRQLVTRAPANTRRGRRPKPRHDRTRRPGGGSPCRRGSSRDLRRGDSRARSTVD